MLSDESMPSGCLVLLDAKDAACGACQLRVTAQHLNNPPCSVTYMMLQVLILTSWLQTALVKITVIKVLMSLKLTLFRLHYYYPFHEKHKRWEETPCCNSGPNFNVQDLMVWTREQFHHRMQEDLMTCISTQWSHITAYIIPQGALSEVFTFTKHM